MFNNQPAHLDRVGTSILSQFGLPKNKKRVRFCYGREKGAREQCHLSSSLFKVSKPLDGASAHQMIETLPNELRAVNLLRDGTNV